MAEHRSTLRFALVLATSLALFATGVVSGACGDRRVADSSARYGCGFP
jgi:hypothetical protein